MEANSAGQSERVKEEAQVASKDLLRLENADYDRKYLICNSQQSVGFLAESGTKSGISSEALTAPIPPSNVLDRVKAFLPALQEENLKLEAAVKERGAQDFDIEALAEDDRAHIRMDLALGIAELYTPEAISKAERSVNGQVLDLPGCNSDSSSDESGYESEDESEDESLSKDQVLDDHNAVIGSKVNTNTSCLKSPKHRKHKHPKLEIVGKEGTSEF